MHTHICCIITVRGGSEPLWNVPCSFPCRGFEHLFGVSRDFSCFLFRSPLKDMLYTGFKSVHNFTLMKTKKKGSVTLPIHLPANFLEMRMGAQFRRRAKYDRSVHPSSQSDNIPDSKSIINRFAKFSSPLDHLPLRGVVGSKSSLSRRSSPSVSIEMERFLNLLIPRSIFLNN